MNKYHLHNSHKAALKTSIRKKQELFGLRGRSFYLLFTHKSTLGGMYTRNIIIIIVGVAGKSERDEK
jgi:hypothetical protein